MTELGEEGFAQLLGGRAVAHVEAQPQHGALMVIAHQAGGVLAVRDLDQVGAADVRVFVDAAGFERPRVVNPTIDLEALVWPSAR